MTDLHNRLNAVKERIQELARLSRAEDAQAAHRLAHDLIVELDHLVETSPEPRESAPRATSSTHLKPRDEVVRCPRCSLRGFTFQKGTLREISNTAGRTEAFYRCSSCGHEGWREID